jgi:hypothetical protein
MTNAMASDRPRRQRASRLSRDLLVELSAAWMAVRLARAVARKLETAPSGEAAARLADEVATHVDTARKALSRAVRPVRNASRRKTPSFRGPGARPAGG